MRHRWSGGALGLLLAACGGQVLGTSDPGAGAGGTAAALGAGGGTGVPIYEAGGAMSIAAVDASTSVAQCWSDALITGEDPSDMYVVLDASASMSTALQTGVEKWTVAQQALETFAQSPRAAGQAMGLAYSPPSVAGASCDAGYGAPDVEVSLLPDGAPPLVQSLEARKPGGVPSLRAALEGAIAHMKARAAASPGRNPLVVLVTGGGASDCTPLAISELALIAKAAFDSAPNVRTAVIGLGDIDPAFDDVAKAGATRSAWRLSGAEAGIADLESQFVVAMLSLSQFPGCSFGLPPTGPNPPAPLDLTKLSVLLTPAATNITELLPRLPSSSACGPNQGKGWYFDDPTTPSKVLLCTQTCAGLVNASIQVVYGCNTEPGHLHN